MRHFSHWTYGRYILAPPGNQAANGENKHQPKYLKKPVYSTQLKMPAMKIIKNGLINTKGGDMGKITYFVFVIIVLTVSACASANQISRLASSRVLPCASEEITVSNVKIDMPSWIQTWNATCHGENYACSGRSDGEGHVTDVSCLKKSGGNSGSTEQQSKKKGSDSRKRRTTRK